MFKTFYELLKCISELVQAGLLALCCIAPYEGLPHMYRVPKYSLRIWKNINKNIYSIMTGPGPGKIEVGCRKMIVKKRHNYINLIPRVYVHIKGWSLARVTHVDVEYPNLENMLELDIHEIVGGRIVNYGNYIHINTSKFVLKIISDLCNIIPRGYRGGCVVGGKIDGIFIGVKKEVITILEELGRRYGYGPKS